MKKSENATYGLQHLQDCCAEGACLYINGREAEPDYVIECMVAEDGAYMGDYVFGENGRLLQIRFDRVSKF